MQIIAYLAIVALYIGIAMVVWVGCAITALVPSRRRGARAVAAAMAGSFPGVFVAQAVAAPVAAACLITGLIVVHLIDPRPTSQSTVAMVLGMTTLFVVLVLLLAASVYGFYVGADIGWRLASGATLDAALAAHRPTRVIMMQALAWRDRRRAASLPAGRA